MGGDEASRGWCLIGGAALAGRTGAKSGVATLWRHFSEWRLLWLAPAASRGLHAYMHTKVRARPPRPHSLNTVQSHTCHTRAAHRRARGGRRIAPTRGETCTRVLTIRSQGGRALRAFFAHWTYNTLISHEIMHFTTWHVRCGCICVHAEISCAVRCSAQRHSHRHTIVIPWESSKRERTARVSPPRTSE